MLAGDLRARQIALVLGAASPPSSHSLAVHTLPFRALATLAARAPLGGDREVVMGCFMAARLLSGALGPEAPSPDSRAERAQAARSWFAALALPANTRAPFARAVDASAGTDRRALAEALAIVIEAAAPYLDAPSRREMEDLGESIVER